MKAAMVSPVPYEKQAIYKPSEEIIEKLVQDQIAEQKILQSRKISYPKTSNGGYCSCVTYAQTLGLGLTGYGLARNYPINSKIPAATGFVVTWESSSGHIAHYVLQGDYLILQEANYSHCHVTNGRVLSVESGIIKGYWNQ